MIQVSGTYNDGNITLDKKLGIKKPVKVIVTFDEEDLVSEEKRLTINDFSFLKSRELLKNVKGNLSDAVIEERRSAL
ncbi:MAG: hypothetical protein ACHQIM_18500 [Sphingobacteriales bacterium]